jgi:hypothetical protein
MTEDVAPWVQTFSGGAVDLLSPQPGQILLVDIAHALSRTARFGGHTRGPLPWNGAQHSLLVESLLPDDADPVTRLLAVLHDAHEAFIGDIVSPMKAALRARTPADAYSRKVDPAAQIAIGLDAAIWAAFALPDPTEHQRLSIREADLLAFRVERDALMASPPRDWLPLPEPPEPLPELVPAMPDEAKAAFIARVRYLVDARHGLYPAFEREDAPGSVPTLKLFAHLREKESTP